MHTLIDRDGCKHDPSLGGRLLLVPLARWRADRATLTSYEGEIGVQLAPADDPADIAGDFDRIALIAVDFPVSTDGRGYSTARLLRQRFGWRGELRAVGDIRRDQLFYLARCGFDSFLLADGESVDAALTAFSDFSERYQGAADRGPLFDRRATASAAWTATVAGAFESRRT